MKFLRLQYHKTTDEIIGRMEAWSRSIEQPGATIAWTRVWTDKKRGKKQIRYAVYRNGKRLRGVKIT
jgi:hypothetical protein